MSFSHSSVITAVVLVSGVMSKVTSEEALADYKSDEDEDYVPDNAADDDDEEDDGPTYDDNGNLIANKSSSRKRKRPSMTINALSQQQCAPQRASIHHSKKKTPTVGAAVISDDEDDWEQLNAQQTNQTTDDTRNNAQQLTAESRRDEVPLPSTPAQPAVSPLATPPVTTKTPPSAASDLHSLLASYNKKSAQTKSKKVFYPWETPQKTAAKPSTSSSELDALLNVHTPTPAPRPALVAESNTVTITTTTSYAGEMIEVKQELVKGSEAERRYKAAHAAKDNLSQIVDSLTGKRSLNTLDKSRVDWSENKRIVGDQQELKQFTKDGFVERQAFLLAAEQREREKLKQQYKAATKVMTTSTMKTPLDDDD